MKTLLTLALFLLATTATAEEMETFTLKYKSTNKWVAAENNAPLQKLITTARAKKIHVFNIEIPKERNLAITRLKVLRDILETSLKTGIMLVETPTKTPPPKNTIKITPTKP